MGGKRVTMIAMALETVRISAVIPASADRVYAAWLDSDEHSRMTGGKASVDPRVDGEHSAWDGYVHGKTLELEPGRRIVQSWRSTDFPLGHGDSRLEVHLLEVAGGTEVTLIHTGIPEGQGVKYGSGWVDHYLTPMTKYFAKSGKAFARKGASKKASRKAMSKKKAAMPKKPGKKVARSGRPTARKKAKPAKKAARSRRP
jgi:uncharacterized protein YndB with AHSA1/START domain